MSLPMTTIVALSDAIARADLLEAPSTVTFGVGDDIGLEGTALVAINLHSVMVLDNIGNSHTFPGGGTHRGLFVYPGTVTIEDLTTGNAKAVGGAVASGGGGGLGAGGDIFVQQGDTPIITVGQLGPGTVSGGSQAGQAFGTGILLQDVQTIILSAAGGQTLKADAIDDRADLGGTSGVGGLLIAGASTTTADAAVTNSTVLPDAYSAIGTTVADSGGNFAIMATGLPDGVHSLTATAADLAGNTSTSSASVGDSDTVNLLNDITETADPNVISPHSGVSFILNRDAETLDSANAQRGLFVYNGTLTMEDLTVRSVVALGNPAPGNGIGLGAGGDIFVQQGGNLIVQGGSPGSGSVTGAAASIGAGGAHGGTISRRVRKPGPWSRPPARSLPLMPILLTRHEPASATRMHRIRPH